MTCLGRHRASPKHPASGRHLQNTYRARSVSRDDIVNGVVANRISQPDCAGGFLLDGYPRTVPQAEFLSGVLKRRGLPEPVVLFLDVPDMALGDEFPGRFQAPARADRPPVPPR